VLREQSEGLSLSDEQLRALSNQLSALPYSGLLPRWRVENFDDVIAMLSAFEGVLRGVSERNDRTERELRQLKDERESFRSFLGIDELRDGIAHVQSQVSGLVGDVEQLSERGE
jgi:hypothetical protein